MQAFNASIAAAMPGVVRPRPEVRTLGNPRPVQRRATSDRRCSFTFGVEAERSVERFLHAGGYVIAGSRVRTRAGEVDVIAVRDDTVAFVEVKARRRGWDGLEAVDARKQGRLSRAAAEWIAANPQYGNCSIRFDIALVWPCADLEYLENAFDALETDEFTF